MRHKKLPNLLSILLFITCPFFIFSQSTEKEIIIKPKTSILNIGYQIGGHTYFGLDYEYKIAGHIGFHGGLGISGYTGGIKLHMNDCMECPHLNISFKDGGFGEIGTLGAELGARLFTFKKDGKLATFAQFGYGYLLYFSKETEEKLFNNDPPQGIFTFGLGLSF